MSLPTSTTTSDQPTPADAEAMSSGAPVSPQPAHSRAMQRVLSQESTGSASTAIPSGSAALATPPISGQPASPASGSGGVATPKARQASLSVEGGGRKDEQLAQDLEELQVRSPAVLGGPEQEGEMEGIQQAYANGNGTGHERAMSGSTDSSDSGSYSQLPSQLGSMYGAEGFTSAPSQTNPYGYMPHSDSPEHGMSAAAAAAVAAADEAVKQLNGTTTVYQGIIPSIPGPQDSASPSDNPYQLPRGYANFVKPQNKHEAGVSRQSSTSSSTTEASTSSEEEDLCIPRIEWVDKEVGGPPPQSWANGFFTPYRAGSSSAPAAAGSAKGGSPARMPPPASTNRITSPRNRHLASPNPGSSGLSAGHTPSGLGRSSALPSGVPPEAMDEDDDDQTIGQRDKSPSTSSHSSQSGLDLLIRAVTHSSSGKERAEEVSRQPAPATYEPTSPAYDGKGKRKAGAEAVDQWRNSGIPTGVGKGKGKTARFRGRDDTVSTEPDVPLAGPPPTKKRRRSSAMEEHEVIDPELLTEEERRPAHPAVGYGHEQQAYANLEEEMPEEESEPDDGASEGDSEYAGEGRGKRSGTGRAKGQGARRSTTARGRTSFGSATHLAGSSKAGTPTGGGAKKGRKTASPSGKVRSAVASSSTATSGQMVPGGVQCEYVNPLPPYNRCQDVFTRKYDLPRHTARHARREGELVYEGKLAEDKALLWATIKDRPKVTCESCGESFTRMDALKRHQAKQHH